MTIDEKIRQAADRVVRPDLEKVGTINRALAQCYYNGFLNGANWMLSEVQPLLCECCRKKVLGEVEKDSG